MRIKLGSSSLDGAAGIALAILVSSHAFASVVAGTDTVGGTRPDARVIEVTNLEDAGPGSLRAAIEEKGPRIIVFGVSGYIKLQKDLSVRNPNVTIAGQTAPSPGVILRDAVFAVRTHDVIVEHLGVYSGPSDDPKINDNRDAISLDARGRGGPDNMSHDIILRNVSMGWSVDETLSTWFPTTRRISIKSSILAEPLRDAGHPKGLHSMALLVGSSTREILVAGNLMAHSSQRNPVLACNTSAAVLNNVIYDPGSRGIHFYACNLKFDTLPARTDTTLQSNVIIPGPGTRPTPFLAAIDIPNEIPSSDHVLNIFASDNRIMTGENYSDAPIRRDIVLASEPPVTASSWKVFPSEKAEAYVTSYAGMQPRWRNPIDKRVIDTLRNRTGRIINSPNDVGGWLPFEQKSRPVALPDRPFELDQSTKMLRIQAWLCLKHFEVGGATNATCRGSADLYQTSLKR